MLNQTLDRHATPLPSNAGLHVTLLLADDLGEGSVRDATLAHDVLVGSLERTYNFTAPPRGIVVGFGALPTDRIAAATWALAAALTEARLKRSA